MRPGSWTLPEGEHPTLEEVANNFYLFSSGLQ
jgi:hypothetical protein